MKNVFVPAGWRTVSPELLQQLRIFGATIQQFYELEEAERLTERLGPAILITDLGRLDREPLFAIGLKRLKERFGSRLMLIFCSDQDDFDSRLKAVRAGADAFFLLPVDATRIAEKIDHLFEQNEKRPYQVLVIDDDPEQLSYNVLVLEQAGMETTATSDPGEAISLIVEGRPDIVLMDMYMPSCTGPELAALIRQNEALSSIPIVFLSVERDLEKQISAIRQGGDEFLEKPVKPDHLVASIAMRAERVRAQRFYMERDALTGMLNHTNLVERLGNEILRARRSGTELCFALIDLDDFKSVNDRYGHLAGDRVISSLSRLLGERLRRTDILGRYGGEEFGVIFPGTDARKAARLLDELRENFRNVKHGADAMQFNVSFSCGIASYPEFIATAELVEGADSALRRAKAEGRDRILVETAAH